MLITPNLRSWSTYTGTHPADDWCTEAPGRSSPTMRGKEGPVRSRSKRPTLVSGERASSDSASWTEDDDLPTPPDYVSSRPPLHRLTGPFPDKTMMMFFTDASRRDTGVSSTSPILFNARFYVEDVVLV